MMETIEFDHTPHYKTICDKRSHFSRASDALAEFIDNSIQACGNNSEKNIGINCFLSKKGSNSFLTIVDNGGGMSEKELKSFAKYSFDQESRGIQHDANDRKNHISKFGVGAKEAGFYLGDKLRVITRPKQSSTGNGMSNPNPTSTIYPNPSSTMIYELSMDEKEYEARFKREESIYLGHIHRFADESGLLSGVGGGTGSNSGSSVFSPDEVCIHELMSHVARHVRQHQHFTMIILRLRPDIVSKFNERYGIIFNELALIYHYYLHPEHGPNVIINETKFQKPLLMNAQQSKSKAAAASHAPEDLPLPKSPYRHANATADVQPRVIITCSVTAVSVPFPRASQFEGPRQTVPTTQHNYEQVYLCNLRDNQQDNLMNRYMRRAKHAFRFNMSLPDPDGRRREDKRASMTQLQKQLAESNHEDSHPAQLKVVEGILFYFPFHNGRETKPSLRTATSSSQVPVRPLAMTQGNSNSKKRSRISGSSSSSAAVPPRKHSHLLHSQGNPDEDEESDFAEPVAVTAAGLEAQYAELENEEADGEYYSDLEDGEDDDEFRLSSGSGSSGSSALQRRQDDTIFSVFWQDRLVPETTLNRIPCFRDLPTTLLDCDNQSMARNWRGRIKGFLFFDWTFHNISNNKLKFTVEPSLEGWLNDLKLDSVAWNPISTSSLLKKWLQGCHKYFDQEIRLEDRALDLERVFRDPRAIIEAEAGAGAGAGELMLAGGGGDSSSSSQCALMRLLSEQPGVNRMSASFFRTLVVASTDAISKLKSNKVVKLFRRMNHRASNSQGSSGSGLRLSAKKEIFGRIVAFEVGRLPSEHDREYHGPGVMLRFQREPIELFGVMKDYCEAVPLAFLGDLNAIEEPTKVELTKLTKQIPADVVFRVYKSSYDCSIHVKCGSSVEVVSDARVLMIGIQVKDKAGALTFGKPAVGRPCRYTVELLCEEEGKPAVVVNSTADLYAYAPSAQGQGQAVTQAATQRSSSRENWAKVTPAEKSVNPNAMWCFDDVVFRHTGPAKLIARIIDKHVIGEPRVVLTRAITVLAEHLPVDRVSMVADWSHMFPMGSPMPQLQFSLFDVNKVPVQYEGKVVVNITAPEEPDMRFSMWDGFGEYTTEVIIELERSDGGEFTLEGCKMAPTVTGYRRLLPASQPTPVLSPSSVETKEIRMVLTLSEATETDSPGAILGQPIEFNMKMCPGTPAILDRIHGAQSSGTRGKDKKSAASLQPPHQDASTPVIELTAIYGTECPDMEIACYDQYMHRTAPDSGCVWKGMLLSKWLATYGQQIPKKKSNSSSKTKSARQQVERESSEEKPVLLSADPFFPVSTAGVLTMRNLRVSSSNELLLTPDGRVGDFPQQLYIPPGGVEVEDTLILVVEGSDAADGAVSAIDVNQCPSIPIHLTVMPNAVATSIRVWWQDRVLTTSEPLVCKVGTVLLDLTLQVLDQHGNVIDFDGDRIFGSAPAAAAARTTGIKISWASKELVKKQKFLTTDQLPELTLRTNVISEEHSSTTDRSEEGLGGRDIVEYSVYCVIPGAGELLTEFAVKLLPDEPVHWTVLTKSAGVKKRKIGRGGGRDSDARGAGAGATALVTACSEEAGNSIPDAVVLDDSASLLSRLAGVCLVDQYGNRIECTAAAATTSAMSTAQRSPICSSPAAGITAATVGSGRKLIVNSNAVACSPIRQAGLCLLGDCAPTNCKVLLKWCRKNAAGQVSSQRIGDGNDGNGDDNDSESAVRASQTTLLKLDPVPRVVDGTMCYVLEQGVSLQLPPSLLPAAAVAGSSHLHGSSILLSDQVPELSIELVDVSELALPVYTCDCLVSPGAPYGLQISSDQLEFATHVVTSNSFGAGRPETSSGGGPMSQRRSSSHRAVPGVSVSKYTLPRDLTLRFYDRNGFLAVLRSGGPTLSVQVVVEDEAVPAATATAARGSAATELAMDREAVVLDLPALRSTDVTLDREAVGTLFRQLEQRASSDANGDISSDNNSNDTFTLSFHFRYAAEDENATSNGTVSAASTLRSPFVPKLHFHLMRLNVVSDVQLICLPAVPATSTSTDHTAAGTEVEGEEQGQAAMEIDVQQPASASAASSFTMASDEEPPPLVLIVSTQNRQPLAWDSDMLVSTANSQSLSQSQSLLPVPDAVALSPAVLRELFKFKILHKKRALDLSDWYDLLPVLLPRYSGDSDSTSTTNTINSAVERLRRTGLYDANHSYFVLQSLSSAGGVADQPTSAQAESARRLPMGKYDISAVYIEQRSSLQELPTTSKKCASQTLTLEVIPSPLVSIAPADPSRLQNCVATNSTAPNIQLSQRVVASDINFLAFDRFQHRTIFPPGALMVCRIQHYTPPPPSTHPEGIGAEAVEAPTNETTTRRALLPKLKRTGLPADVNSGVFVASSALNTRPVSDILSGIDTENLLFAQKLPSGEFRFPCVELREASDGNGNGNEDCYRDGLVQLTFELYASAEALRRSRTCTRLREAVEDLQRCVSAGDDQLILELQERQLELAEAVKVEAEAEAGSASLFPTLTYMTAFMLTTDQARSAKIREMQRDVELLSALVHTHEARVDEQTAAVEDVTRRLHRCVQACHGKGIRTFLEDLDALTQHEAATLHGQIRGQISDMRARQQQTSSRHSNILNASSLSVDNSVMSHADGTEESNIRPAVKNGIYPTPAQLLGFSGVVGLVVDLGKVEDYNEAYILSWAGLAHLDCVVVEEDGVAQQMFEAKIKVWSLDQMRPFMVSEPTTAAAAGGRGERVLRFRNAAEMQARALPLPPVFDSVSKQTPEGNPEYLVNLVRLPAALEHLRDTVFYNIYKNSLLFDDVRTANVYRKTLLARKAQVPTIFTRDGNKIGSEGVLNPRPGQGVLPPTLPSVYGAPDPDEEEEQENSGGGGGGGAGSRRRKHKEELEELQKDDEALVEIEELIEERERLQRKLDEILAEAETAGCAAPFCDYSIHVQEIIATLGVTVITVSVARRLLQQLDDRLAKLGLGNTNAGNGGVVTNGRANSRDPRIRRGRGPR